MRTVMAIAAASIAALCMQSCRFVKVKGKLAKGIISSEVVEAKGDVMTREMADVADFSTIVCEGSYDINYVIGDSYLKISAPENVIEHIVANVENGVLKVGTDGTKFRNLKNVTVIVKSPALDKIVVDGAADVAAPQIRSNGTFDLEINGAADIDIDSLEADNINVTINGAGDLDMEGLQTGGLKVEINGAGDVKAWGRAHSANFTINGAGSIDAKRLDCPDINTNRNGIGKVYR